MTIVPGDSVTVVQVRAAAQLVALTLSDADAAAVATLLSQWIPAATALSTRMQAPDLTTITPITVFITPDDVCPTPSSPEGTT